MCEAVDKANCPVDLALRNPGLLNHSRWLTTANRILRLYFSVDSPSCNLKTLVTFIIRVYAPMWFAIKSKPSCKDEARHDCQVQMIARSRYLSDNLKKIVDPVIRRNAYCSHPKNVLLAMLTDGRPHIRQLSLRRILKARSTEKSGEHVRKFCIPTLNFDAVNYEDMIDWSGADTPVTEPPVMMRMTDTELKDLIKADVTPTVLFPRFPCHTQAVERCVKLVTEASAAVCCQKSRDGLIRVKIASRKLMPKFESKCDFAMLCNFVH